MTVDEEVTALCAEVGDELDYDAEDSLAPFKGLVNALRFTIVALGLLWIAAIAIGAFKG